MKKRVWLRSFIIILFLSISPSFYILCAKHEHVVFDEFEDFSDNDLDMLTRELDKEIPLSFWEKIWLGYEVLKWQRRITYKTISNNINTVTTHLDDNKQVYTNLLIVLFFALSGEQESVDKDASK